MDRGSDKLSPRLDDEYKEETEGLLRSGRQTRAEEWHQLEPSGEDEPDVDRDPAGTMSGGTPPGMDADDVAGRSELARHLGRAPYPVVREQLIEEAAGNHAPTAVLDSLRRLPSGRTFDSLNEVWETLGGHTESRRF